MKYIIIAFFLAFPISSFCQKKIIEREPIEYVNALMGTASNKTEHHGIISNGYVNPVIGLPFGMQLWSPQTGPMKNRWIYSYNENYMYGIRQTSSPSPWMSDYGAFNIMATTGEMVFKDEERKSWYSHKSEEAHPYYYAVYLADHDATIEVAPTERCSFFRFSSSGTKGTNVIIDAFYQGSYIKADYENNRIIGYSTQRSRRKLEGFKNYFVIQFEKPFAELAIWQNDTLVKNVSEFKGEHAGAVLRFKTNEKITAKVATSYISFEQAELNMREIGNKNFDQIKEEAKDKWNKELSRVELFGGTEKQISTFYTCLYRMLIYPRKIFEINGKGEIVHFSPFNGKVLPGYLFTDTGFWDTFRAQFPFFNLMYTGINKQFMQSLLNVYNESGWLPEWSSPGHKQSMIGSHSASVIADAYIKGIRGYDINTLYEAILKNSENEGPIESLGRKGVDYYNKLGYVPYDVGITQSVSRTLEYAYDDFAIYNLAKKLNRPKKEIKRFAERCQYYKNVYDPQHMLMRGKNEDGTFQSPFNPFRWGVGFTEGCSWHYTWSVMHDATGLAKLMGGQDKFIAMIDSIFNISPLHVDVSYYKRGTIHLVREMQNLNMGQYTHGNEPMQHVPYLYNFGAPWKAQFRLREIMDRLYAPTPDGFAGDDDNGQTSAWYFFSALGFYPVCPATDQYMIGTPLFHKVILHLENGKDITINAPGASAEKRYINSVLFNGKAYTKNWFSHSEMTKGCTISFEMSDKPNTKKGTKPEDFPFSFSDLK